ncbi:endonuclease domain-containing protein [Marinifilum flexuosum]|uniref:Very-short-patch-repair endonuclease n=1 Tax=Marinifilum flexuosum TaxID=1117708 RepID=A0A419X634_9BACT|nr:endonuclease domain-containing protein [Marinifilum flexuosum]RKE03162.1 very-short-patch-repair endonuclease [Marinifilum flexuosum]
MSISDQVTMFYNAKPHIFEKAKSLRQNMTETELKLWDRLKGKKIQGLRFRAQHPIDIFIADFYCHSIKLVIELDGGMHLSKEQKEYDIGREAEINHWDIKVIRFTNDEVAADINTVVLTINEFCTKRIKELTTPNP